MGALSKTVNQGQQVNVVSDTPIQLTTQDQVHNSNNSTYPRRNAHFHSKHKQVTTPASNQVLSLPELKFRSLFVVQHYQLVVL